MIPANYFRDLPAEYSMVTISTLKLAGSYRRGELSGGLLQIALKVKGPIYVIPDFWATNDNPAIKAEINKHKLHVKNNFFCDI